VGFNEFSIASAEDGNDITIEPSMDSPGSSPEFVYDETTGEYVEVDCDGQPVQDDEPGDDYAHVVEAIKASLPPHAHRQREVLDFIARHPGCTRAEVFAGTGAYPKPFGGRPNPLDRLVRKGFVYDLGRCNRAALYVISSYAPYVVSSYDRERAAGMWTPGHP
jgi:hypothetical protein